MKALVIGGTGLISGGIVRELVRKGHRATVFHRGSSPLKVKGVREILGDRKDRSRFEAAVGREKWDAVFDLISFDAEDAASAIRAFRGKAEHFIHCSTVCAVGVPTVKVPSDETEPYHPVSGYGRGKAAGERLLLAAWRASRFPVTIFRPSHTYGPGAGWVLGTFLTDWGTDCELINRIRKGKPVVVHGDGTTLWQSCFVDDAAAGFVGAVGKRRTLGQVYNICGRDIITWDDYFRAVGRACGRAPRIVHLPTDLIVKGAPASATGFLTEIAVHHGAYAIDKIRRDIPEFRPTVDVEEGTRRHVKWLKAGGRLRLAPKRPFEDRLAALAARMGREAGRKK